MAKTCTKDYGDCGLLRTVICNGDDESFYSESVNVSCTRKTVYNKDTAVDRSLLQLYLFLCRFQCFLISSHWSL
jgi:hypothetical protein